MMPERIWAASLPVSTGSIKKWDEHHQEYAFTSEDEYIRSDIHETELRRCRADTLREILNIAEGSTLIMALEGAQFVQTLRRMAEEAEQEADHDA